MTHRDKKKRTLVDKPPITPIPDALAESPVPGCMRTDHPFRCRLSHSATVKLLLTWDAATFKAPCRTAGGS
jgi:hypothetical protein